MIAATQFKIKGFISQSWKTVLMVLCTIPLVIKDLKTDCYMVVDSRLKIAGKMDIYAMTLTSVS